MREGLKQNVFLIGATPVFVLLAVLLLTTHAGSATEHAPSLDQAQQAFQQGRFDKALELWEAALSKLSDTERFDVLLQIAATYRAQGRVREAFSHAKGLSAFARATKDRARLALSLSAHSDGYLLSRQLDKAERLAVESVTVARGAKTPVVLATTLNQLGNVLMARQSYGKALDTYDEALGFAEQVDDEALVVKILTNVIHGHLATNSVSEAAERLETAQAKARVLPESRDKLFSLIALGHLAQRLARSTLASRDLLAYTAFSEALALAEVLQSLRGKSFAMGHMGELYATARRFEDARRLFHQALFYAEEANAPELSARWQWQLGRLHKAQNRGDAAKAAYRRALDHLQLIQPALVFGHRGYPTAFRDDIGQIYRELAELLLASASTATDAEQQQNALRKIRDAMEAFKAVELKDYFLDDCVTAQQEKNRALDLDGLIKPGTATLYPVIFRDRTVMLLSLAGGDIKFVTVPVNEANLRQAANTFRRQMHPGGNPRRLLKQAQRLYKWLIKPLEPDLTAERIDTLVMVPDGVLRTIPFAALHDGEHYMVERFAIVVTPGLLLTDSTQLSRTEPQLLINGLSQGVQGFDPLPHVSAEVAGISSMFKGKQLIDEGFVKANLISELERNPYHIVSFSTHGYFDSNPEDSFLLTYDDKLTLDELERFVRISEFREQPVEMIVLSACDTAVGDERAALGLAGIALKAGARSAMASLWAVNDESTAELVPAFFENLKKSELSKAQALQQAQLKRLRDQRTKHPYYWAPFVLIGNWF